MIKNIKLKFGSAPGEAPISIDNPMITVFVGPNNSGKSEILREISRFCLEGDQSVFLLLDRLFFREFSEAEYDAHYRNVFSPPRQGDGTPQGYSYIKVNDQRFQIKEGRYRESLINPNERSEFIRAYAQYHARHFFLGLNGEGRMHLVHNQSRGDLKNPTGSFARLITRNDIREKLRAKIYDAFGIYVGLDMSEGDQLSLKFGETPPPNERGIEDDMLSWSRRAKGIDRVSDGVKAYTGMLLNLYVGEPKAITIDEPEAFLHPSLSFKLGQELAKLATEYEKHVFVSTHSSHFLMGVIQSGARVNVVRLTYEGGVPTARLLPDNDLRAMMQDPFLRSANVMSGLFYKHVVVTEADADRAFYQEINDRLYESDSTRGCSNTLFLNANGEDTVHRIVAPLRRLGIPAAAIVDIDVLNQGGTSWTNHLKALSIPEIQHQPLGTQRDSAWTQLTAEGKNPKTEGGVSLLQGSEKEAVENLFDELKRYGFFVVPIGEVERWFSDLDINRAKQTWLRSIFEKMGNDPNDASYLRPTNDDVWAFMDEAGAWLKNPSRKGIPA